MQCPYCNQQHPDNTTFCPNTGRKIERVAAARPAPKPRGRLRLFSWIVIVVCGLCGMVVIGFLALLVLWKTPALSPIRLAGASATATVKGSAASSGGSTQGSWTNSGPEGGDVTALAVDPADAKVVYAGTSAAGIFKSTDAGGTWAPANKGLADASSLYVLSLAVDPQQPATLYAGTDGGLYKSTDSGATWLRLTLDSSYNTYSIPFLAVSPQAHTTVYAVEMSGKFLKSTDGGVTWSTSEIGGSSDYISVMAVDPAGVIYANTMNTLEQSHDGGTTWTSLPLSNDYASAYSLAFDPAHPGTILAGTDDGVIKSVDGGHNWKATNLDKADVETLAVDPGTTSTVYAAAITGGHVDYGASTPKKGLFVSTDGGDTWKKVKTGDLPGEQITSMLITPEGLLAGTRRGFFKGTSAADGWTASNSGLMAIPFTSLAVASNPPVLYAGTGGFGVYQSSDGGLDWEATGAGLPGGYVPVVAVDPQTPTTLYAVVESEPRQSMNNNGFDGLYKSLDAGKTWKTIDSGSSQGFNSDSLLIDPQAPTTMYTLSNFEGFHKSLDGGVTWTEANTGLGEPSSIQAIVMDGVNPQVLYAMSFEHFYTTTDGARTWTEVPTDLQIFSIKFLWADPLRAGTLYGSSYTDGQLKSTDGGAHWTSAGSPGGMDEGFTLLAVDPRQPANLFGMGVNNTFANLWIGSPLMLGVSRDGGESWSRVDTGLGGIYVYALLLDPADPSIIYLGTTQGFFKGQYTAGP